MLSSFESSRRPCTNLRVKENLRVRDLCLVNLALLAKWRSRFITYVSGLWCDIIKARECVPFIYSLKGGSQASD